MKRIFVFLLIIGIVTSLGISRFLTDPTRIITKANTSSSAVTIQNGKLLVDGQPFTIRGVNYNPTSAGNDQLDPNAPAVDVPNIAALGANTIGTYWLGKAEYAQWSDLRAGENLYANLYPVAEAHNLKLIVGYFSNASMDWTDSARVAKVTRQYQELVMTAKDRPSTLVYMIGNEIIEKLGSDAQKTAYAKWIGQMVDWTHANDPRHPTMYADNMDHPALPYLKAHAPNLDIYALNNYRFTTADELTTMVTAERASWPGKAIMIHEWGVDSYDVKTKREDENLQATGIQQLAQIVESVSESTALTGGLLFEYSDEWRFVSPVTTQDPDAGWSCPSCFDGKANEDYWGLTKSAPNGSAGNRVFKSAYQALKQTWGSSAQVLITPTLHCLAFGDKGGCQSETIPTEQPSVSEQPSATPPAADSSQEGLLKFFMRILGLL